jgi:hypothetical protein
MQSILFTLGVDALKKTMKGVAQLGTMSLNSIIDSVAYFSN